MKKKSNHCYIKKFNSVEERFNMHPRFPHWKASNKFVGSIQPNQFQFYEVVRILQMISFKVLKLFTAKKVRALDHAKPVNSGKVWMEHEGGLDWYTWMLTVELIGMKHLCCG